MVVVVLFDASGPEFLIKPEAIERLARLGVTNVAVVRDDATVGVVLDGWAFDERTCGIAVAALHNPEQATVLRPVAQIAVARSVGEGGRE